MVVQRSYGGVMPWDSIIGAALDMSKAKDVAVDTSVVPQFIKSSAPLYIALGVGGIALVGLLAYVALKD